MMSTFLRRDSLINVHNSFIMWNFNYFLLVRHLCGTGNIRKLEKLHKRALRIIKNDFESSYVDLLGKTNTSTIFVSRLRKLALFVSKALNNECNPISNNILMNCSNLNYKTMFVRNIKCPHVNSVKYGTNSIQNQGALFWNSLLFVIKTQYK